MSKIETNKALATRLGWSPRDFNEDAFDEGLVDAIATYQRHEIGLVPDGVCGPKTFRHVVCDQIAEHLTMTPFTLADRGELALLEARRRWLTEIRDDASGRQAIQDMIVGSGGLGWSWINYTGDGSFEWCGAFAAVCWGLAGLRIPHRYTYFASTFRLDAWGAYRQWQPEHKPEPRPKTAPRMMINLDEHSTPAHAVFPDGSTPRAGDILLVGGKHTGPGRHITVIENFDPTGSGTFATFEGNAHGVLPDGTRGQGVVRAVRRIGLHPTAPPTTYHARRIIRPSPLDCA